MKTYTIDYDKNKSTPGFFKVVLNRGNVQGSFKIYNGDYNLYNEDQSKWNILAGIRYPKNLKSNGIFVVWRYDINSKKYQIAPYGVQNNKEISPRSYIEVDKEEIVRFSLYISSENSIILFSKKQIAATERFEKTPYGKIGLLATPSFHQPSPHNVVIQLGYYV